MHWFATYCLCIPLSYCIMHSYFLPVSLLRRPFSPYKQPQCFFLQRSYPSALEICIGCNGSRASASGVIYVGQWVVRRSFLYCLNTKTARPNNCTWPVFSSSRARHRSGYFKKKSSFREFTSDFSYSAGSHDTTSKNCTYLHRST